MLEHLGGVGDGESTDAVNDFLESALGLGMAGRYEFRRITSVAKLLIKEPDVIPLLAE